LARPLPGTTGFVQSGLRVLVVDDSPDVRMAVRFGLEVDDRFAEVVEAANGADAIEAAAGGRPDVILLDEQMPGMSGTEALPALRNAVPDARIVVFSAVAEHLEIDLRASAADAVVAKGCDFLDLFDALAGV
jgi:CheY-like chemotaxis protein